MCAYPTKSFQSRYPKHLCFYLASQVLASEADNVLGDQEANNDDIDELIDELESLTDSDPELDVISVMSTPKPRLR